MRELEFLPTWYPLLRKRHRMLVIQTVATVAIILTLLGTAGLKRIQVHAARKMSAKLAMQLSQTRQDVARLDSKLNYQQELRRQDQIIAKLGIGVDPTRVMAALQSAMTPDMALTNLTLEASEQVRPAVLHNTRRAGPPATYLEQAAEVDRQLKVTVDGVAPSDMEIATLMTRLTADRIFENVVYSYLRDGRTRDGHLTRDFEITFDLNLNAPTEGR